MPQPLVCRNYERLQAAAPPFLVSYHHKLQYSEQVSCNLKIGVIAGVVECDENLV